LFLLFVLTAVFASPAYAKVYYLDKAYITMHVNSDASVDVEENITFDFRDSFTYAYRDFGKGYWMLSNVSVYENGTPLRFDTTDQENTVRIRWYYNASNEKRTFSIRYHLTNFSEGIR